MNLQLTKKLQDADHWETIEKLSQSLIEAGEKIKDFHDTLEHIGEIRSQITEHIVRADLLKDAIRMKFSIGDIEWSKERAYAEEIIESEYDRKNIDTISVPVIPAGLI